MATRRLVVIVASWLLAGVALATPDQPGTLDATWAPASPLGAGKLRAPISGNFDRVNAVAVQPDGKVVAAGGCSQGGSGSICVARFLPDGSLDTSFNGTGYSQQSIAPGNNSARGLALQRDGKIVVAGVCPNTVGGLTSICALRFNSDGSLDTTFNGSGKVVTDFGSQAVGEALAVLPDGKLLIAGHCLDDSYKFCLLRYNANGSLDTTFNGSGLVLALVSGSGASAYAMAVQPDGKIVLGGECVLSTYDFCLARYLPDGSADTSFNGSGQQAFAVGSSFDTIYAIAIQPDGGILVAGECYTAAQTPHFCGARLLTNGQLDNSFQSSGIFMHAVNTTTQSSARALLLQPSGKFLLIGTCVNNATDYFCANQYHSDGQLDLAVNGNGRILTAMTSGADGVNAAAVQPDGKLLLAGSCSSGGSSAGFCIARYEGGPFGYRSCSPDVDGDGAVLATTDALIQARVALGFTGAAVTNGINFASHAARKTWPAIRDFLTWQCGMSLAP